LFVGVEFSIQINLREQSLKSVCHLTGFMTVAVAACVLTSTAAEAGWNGEWARDDGLVRTRLAPCGGKICAVNTWAKGDGDEKAGDTFVLTLVATDRSHWTGSAFDRKRNLSYSMDMSLDGGQLTTRGCLAGSSLCKTVEWKRVGN
jgi:uncharacterized protein (DUF2147 family)